MMPWREPPWAKIYFGHAFGTALLGMLMLSAEQTKSLHPYTQPILEWFPGAISLSKQAPDPVSTQVFLVISMLIAACLLIGAVWHVSRGSYHTKTFENERQRLLWITVAWILAIGFCAIFWNTSYGLDGAQTRLYFLIRAAISSEFGVVTAMNQLVVGFPLLVLLMPVGAPFHTKIQKSF